MAGAPALAGASALRSGAGLVRVLCPAEVQPTVASFEPSYLTYPVANDDEGLTRFEPARQALERFLPRADVLALGPGLGQSDELRPALERALASGKPALVNVLTDPSVAYPRRSNLA